MRMKTIGLWVGFICIFLCSCGWVTPQEQGGTEQWQQDTKKEKTASPQPSEEPKESYECIEKKDIQIGGRSYISIAYIKTESGKIYLYSLKTKEDVLYIPSEIEGCPVLGVGAPKMITAEYTLRLANWKEITTSDYPWNIKRRRKVKWLKKVVIPNGIIRIDDMYAVADEVIISESVREIADDALMRAKIKKVIVKSKKVVLGSFAFAYSKLEEIQFPDHYTADIGPDCFRETNLKTFRWPSYGTQSKDIMYVHPFQDCKKLRKIIFPENQQKIEIPERCFLGCTKLTKLEFPASTKKVVYRETYYADNYKNGISTLVFHGENTKVVGEKESTLSVSTYTMPKGHTLITAKRIIAPKGSKAIQSAKKALKISFMREWSRKEEEANCESHPFTYTEDELVPMEYEYLP